MQFETLTPPVLLIAMPQVVDPFFNRSVILLLEHSSEGSFGVVVNRPLELKISDAIRDLEVDWEGLSEAVVFFGGPVQPNAGMTLFEETREEEGVEVTELRVANDRETLRKLAKEPPERFRLVVGYAGWGRGQLENELSRGDWLLAPVDAKLIFSTDASGIWGKALDSIGVRPEALPVFTGREESGN